jgi:hypothetical protein
MPEPEYSLEVIRRYHEMKAEHAFYRGIKERRPAGLDRSAGSHERTVNYLQIDITLRAAELPGGPASGSLRCEACAQA